VELYRFFPRMTHWNERTNEKGQLELQVCDINLRGRITLPGVNESIGYTSEDISRREYLHSEHHAHSRHVVNLRSAFLHYTL